MVDCQGCHKDGRYRTGMTACADCHTDDPHKGRLKEDCEQCHTTEGFKGEALLFDHDVNTVFPITALHRDLSCARCHEDETYTVKGKECATCHVEAEAFFAGTLFPDRAEPMPDTMHGRVKCEDCHLPDDLKAAAYRVRPRCIQCHNPAYGIYLNECLALVAERLNAWEADSPDEESLRILEAVKKYAPHNFRYALHLLNRP
jgi:hypothetical protein